MRNLKAILALALFFTFAFGESFDEFDFEEEFAKKEVYDPFITYNRAMTSINDTIYTYALLPVARGYDAVLPDPIQGAFSNFFHNLLYPVRVVNSLLQGKFEESWRVTKRFLINTTIGFAGFSDAAAMHFDLKRGNEDFGQTLGAWGIKSGPYIVLPLLGPSNLRDSFGLVGDWFLNPVGYATNDGYQSLGVASFNYLNEASLNTELYPNLKKEAVDLYLFLRDGYEQRREYMIKE